MSMFDRILDNPTLITALGAFAVAVASGLFAWSSGRRKTNIDYAGVVNAGFKSLLDTMTEQHVADAKEIDVLKSAVHDLVEQVHGLSIYVAQVEHYLRSHGWWDRAPKHNLVGLPKINGS